MSGSSHLFSLNCTIHVDSLMTAFVPCVRSPTPGLTFLASWCYYVAQSTPRCVCITQHTGRPLNWNCDLAEMEFALHAHAPSMVTHITSDILPIRSYRVARYSPWLAYCEHLIVFIIMRLSGIAVHSSCTHDEVDSTSRHLSNRSSTPNTAAFVMESVAE